MNHGASRGRLESIDILRGLAAFGVFVFHVTVFAGFPKRTLPPFHALGHLFSSVPSPLTLGACGVNLFFVLSGFCLALQRLNCATIEFGATELPDYARNRAARIAPAYWVTIFMASALSLVDNFDVQRIAVDAGIHALFLHGFRPDYFISLHGGLWSMATEVEFYALFPALVWFWARFGIHRLVWASIVFNLTFRFVVAHIPALDVGAMSWKAMLSYQLPGRLSEFVLGMAVAEGFTKGFRYSVRTYQLLFVALLGPVLWIRGWGPYWLPDLAFGIVFAVFLTATVSRQVPHGNERAMRWAAAFGRTSYSFFLVHFLVLAALTRFIKADPGSLYGRAAFLTIVGLPLSALAGWMLWWAVEVPFWKRWSRTRAHSISYAS